MKQVIVAGCGAAGMMAAIMAARAGAAVTVLEGMDRPGKKLLLTGNGRCNLTNLEPDLPDRYHGFGDTQTAAAAAQVIRKFSAKDTLAVFHSLGLFTMEKNGYVYPGTAQASSVLDLLLAEMKRRKVKQKLSEKVVGITKGNGRWTVRTENWNYECDSLILCCGSRAAAATGSDGSGYELARQAGHQVTSILPGLTALYCQNSRFFGSCAGVRVQAAAALYRKDGRNGRVFLASDEGELQITENGLSGIVIFQISRYASIGLERGEMIEAELDFAPYQSEDGLYQFMDEIQTSCLETDIGSAQALAGLLPKKLLLSFLEKYKIKPGTPIAGIAKEKLRVLSHEIKHFCVPVTGIRSFDQCQVCVGGVPMSEIDPDTMESRLAGGLYFAGEMVDVDGPCGGYNLQWAWSSGALAGRSAAAEQKFLL